VRAEELVSIRQDDALLAGDENDGAPALGARDGEREVAGTYPLTPVPPRSRHNQPIKERGPRIPCGGFVWLWNSVRADGSHRM
jgi:hypothetical protein